MKNIGVLLLLVALPMVAGAQEGVRNEYFPDGRVSEVWTAFEDGYLSFVAYHENGRIKERGGYIDGLRHGQWSQYDEQGQRVCRVRFDHGAREGTWKLRGLDGTVRTLEYRKNLLVRAEERDLSGEVISQR